MNSPGLTPNTVTVRGLDHGSTQPMTLSLRPADETDRAGWNAFLASRPEGDVLQTWAWGLAGADDPDERWSRLLVVDGGGHIRGVAQILDHSTLLGRSVLYVPHGPVWDRDASDSAEVLARLLTGLKAHARRQRGVTLKLDPRGTGDAAADAAFSRALRTTAQSAVHDLQAACTRIVDLTAGDDPTAGWTTDARAQARRAEAQGTTVVVDRRGDEALLDAFHELLASAAEGTGMPVRSRRFLSRLSRSLVASDDWFMAIAEHDGLPLAGAIAPRCADRAYYLYAASVGDPVPEALSGPYAVMAALQRALRDAGTTSLDLWGVHDGDEADAHPGREGSQAFKRSFGGTVLRHPGTFDIVIDPTSSHIRHLRERLSGARS